MKNFSLVLFLCLVVEPRAGGLWAYGFAVLYFGKKFVTRGPQSGADERGFRHVVLFLVLFGRSLSREVTTDGSMVRTLIM